MLDKLANLLDILSIARSDQNEAAQQSPMKLGNSIGSPPGDGNGLVGRLQSGTEIAGAIQSVGKIGQHASLEFQPGPRAAGKINRFRS
jgi:hypothetical protein